MSTMLLDRLLDKGYAVAFRKVGRKVVHVRAVRDETVVESENETPELALEAAYDKITNKKKSEANA